MYHLNMSSHSIILTDVLDVDASVTLQQQQPVSQLTQTI